MAIIKNRVGNFRALAETGNVSCVNAQGNYMRIGLNRYATIARSPPRSSCIYNKILDNSPFLENKLEEILFIFVCYSINVI
jgi:hypothetical protein